MKKQQATDQEVSTMKEIEKRFIVTTLLAIDFVFVATSGLILEFAHLDKALEELIKDFHIVTGIIMILLVVIHFWYNWRMYKSEFKTFFK